MKKEYEALLVDVVKFEALDVITVFQDDPTEGLQLPLCGVALEKRRVLTCHSVIYSKPKKTIS